VYAVPGNVTNKNSWGPNTLIKQGAKLAATWEDIWEAPADVRLALTPETGAESPGAKTASLFEEPPLSPREKKIYKVLKADEAMHLDEIIEKLEPELSSCEIFAALFELELAGKVKQLPGKNFARRFQESSGFGLRAPGFKLPEKQLSCIFSHAEKARRIRFESNAWWPSTAGFFPEAWSPKPRATF
jgi:hypothetical protein